MRRPQPSFATALLLVVIIIAGSAAAAPKRKKRRAPARRAPALSAAWSAADSKQAVEALLSAMISDRGWVDAFRKQHGRRPLVAVYPLGNRSSAHGPRTLIGKALRARLRRPRLFEVRFRRSGGRGRRRHRARVADYLLDGFFFASNDAKGGRRLRHHVLALQLLDVRSNEKIWLGLHDDKRLLEYSTVGQRGPKIRRVAPGETIDLSGSFSGDDGRRLARGVYEELRRQLRARRQPRRLFIESLPLRNRTSFVIDYRLLSVRLEALLLANRQVRLLASHPETLSSLRRERARAKRGQRWRPRSSDAILSGEIVVHAGVSLSFHLSARITRASTAEVLYNATAKLKKARQRP